MVLEKDEKDAVVETLIRRVQGEDIEFPIPLTEIDEPQIEMLAQEATERAKNADVDDPQNAVWTVIGRELGESIADDFDHETISADREAAYADREVTDEQEQGWTEIGRAIGRNMETAIDWDAVGRETAEAIATDRETIDHRRTAIYKTQLQRGGRVSVPDAEIKTLGLEPGDTLQIRLTRLESVNGE